MKTVGPEVGTDIAASLAAVKDRIAAAAQRSGRDVDDVVLVGVTKTHPAETVDALAAAGVPEVGENRVQETALKIERLDGGSSLRWHLLGPLQSNKVRRAAVLFDLIHSVGSVRVAEALDRAVSSVRPDGLPLPVLLQLNVSGEVTKSGFDVVGGSANKAAVAEFVAAAARIAKLANVRPVGLMTIAPYADDPQLARPVFQSCAGLRDVLRERVPWADWRELSMGMSGDFEVAVEEGATFVRLGRVLLGDRPAPERTLAERTSAWSVR